MEIPSLSGRRPEETPTVPEFHSPTRLPGGPSRVQDSSILRSNVQGCIVRGTLSLVLTLLVPEDTYDYIIHMVWEMGYVSVVKCRTSREVFEEYYDTEGTTVVP